MRCDEIMISLRSVLIFGVIGICVADDHEFQRYDGWYNNPHHPSYGAVGSTLIHQCGANYVDNIGQMHHPNRPPPGLISDKILRGPDGLETRSSLTAFFAFFGQFVASEIVSTVSSGEIACPPERWILEFGQFGHSDENGTIMNISIREAPFFRAAYDPDTGLYPGRPRKPINFVSSWIDGSEIYGTSQPSCDHLRTFENGLIEILSKDESERAERVKAESGNTDEFRVPDLEKRSSNHHLFAATAKHASHNPILMAFNILFRRYHNHWASKLRNSHPDWTDEQLFQRARRYVIAILQNIIAYEYLPALLRRNLTEYHRYESHIDPSISVEFQSAAFRVGHTMVPSAFFLRPRSENGSKMCNSTAFRAIPLCAIFWDVDWYFRQPKSILDDLIRGLVSQRMERSDAIFSDAVQNRLFGDASQSISESDLVALDILRGRDVGVANYKTARSGYKLKSVSFERFDKSGQFDRLKSMYNHSLENLDLYIGGLLEIDESESIVGETFTAIIVEQFQRLRDGDRFWFENKEENLFDANELEAIRNTRMIDVIVASTGIDRSEIQERVFVDSNSPCVQPYQLNSSVADADLICGWPKSHDYFTGSEGCFIASICVLFAIPLVCCLIAFILAHYKNETVPVRPKLMKRISIKRMTSTHIADAFSAEECTDYKATRKVQIILDKDMLQLRTYTREAKLLRMIDFVSMPVKIMLRISCDVDKNCALVVHIPKEYDLVLSFDTLDTRLRFVEAFGAFLQAGIVKRHVLEVHVPMDSVLDYATTLAQRRNILASFFHTAFDQVLHAQNPQRRTARKTQTRNAGTPVRVRTAMPKNLLPRFGGSLRVSSQSPGTKAKWKRALIMTELNKQEFAEAFQLKADSLFVKQMFLLADKDQNGYISYPEFIDILALLSKGTLESKMRMLFDMYDLDGTNTLDRNELTVMISSLLDIAGDRLGDGKVEQLISGMMDDCNLASKELLTFDDFLLLIESHQAQLADDLSNRGFGFTQCEQDMNKQKSRPGDSPSPVIEQNENESAFMKKWKQWIYYLENNWSKVFIMMVFVSFCVTAFFSKASEYYFLKEHIGARQVTGFGVCISRGASIALSFCFAILLLAVCRNLMTILRTTWMARVIPFDDAITFHRYVAYVALCFSVIHVIGHGINFYEISTQPPAVLRCTFPNIQIPHDYMPTFSYWLYGTISGMTGVLLVACLSIIYVFANGIARQHIYNAFYLTHRLFIAVYLLSFIHGSSNFLQEPVFWWYVTGPIGLYVMDWIISLQTECTPAKILRAEVLPSDVLHLRFKPRNSSAFNYHSGQYIRIACADISEQEYHPFTITTAPHEKHMSVHIRAVGPWTRRVLNLFKELESCEDAMKHPKIYLDGPYGSSHQDWKNFEVVVLVGAGIGVTPHASVLKDLIHKVYQARSDITCGQVYFAWVARTHTQFEWFIDILREVEKQDEQNLARTDIFITQLMKDFDLRTMMLYICEHQFQRLSNTSLFTGLSAKTHFGRPNFNQYLFSIKRRHSQASKIGVFTCGPKTIVRSVESACNELNQLYPDGPRLVAHHEIF